MSRRPDRSGSREREQQLWQLFDRLRASSPVPIDAVKFLHALADYGLEPSAEDASWFAQKTGRAADYYSVADWLLAFIRRLGSGREASSILIPFDMLGVLATTLQAVPGAQPVVSLVGSLPLLELLQTLYPNTAVLWHYVPPDQTLRWLAAHDGAYDFVAGFPAIGERVRGTIEGDQLGLRPTGEFGHIAVANAALKLNADGLAAFVVSDRFFATQNNVQRKLAQQGLYVNAVFGLPPRTLSGVSIVSNLIVISRTETESYFVAELTEHRGRNETILRLFEQLREVDDPTMGRLVKPVSFINVRTVMRGEHFQRTAEKLGLTPYSLDEIATAVDLIDRAEVGEHPSNTVYIPQRPGPVYALPGDLSAHKYWRLTLDPARASADYVVRLLNTDLGKSMIAAYRSGDTIPNLSRGAIANLSLYLPSLEVQKRIAQVDIEVDTFIAHLSELREQLWSTPQQNSEAAHEIRQVLGGEQDQRYRFEDWLDTLPFPLASILWAYHATNDPFKKYRLLQRYFEGLTQFMAAMLLSGFYNAEDWITNRHQLFNRYSDKGEPSSKLKEATFGIWKGITEALTADLYKYLQPDNNKLSPELIATRQQCEWVFATREELLAQLFPKSLIAVMRDTNTLRNEWRGHGGLDDSAAPSRLIELEAHLNTTRELLGRLWTEYRLIQPISSRMVAGTVFQDVKLLMGHHNPFITETIELDEQLDSTFLYLHTPGQRRALKLQPLIRILAKVVGDQNATYFYSRIKKSGVVFISHHYEQEPDITERFAETIQLLNDLENLSPKGE